VHVSKKMYDSVITKNQQCSNMHSSQKKLGNQKGS